MSRLRKPVKCPECEADWKCVIDSRSVGIGIRRRRVCVNGHRFTTYEQPVKYYDHMQETKVTAEVIIDLIREMANRLEDKIKP